MKKLITYLFTLIFSLCICTTAWADTNARVIDNAGLLNDSEKQKLESRIEEISGKYDFDIVIMTTNTIDGKTPQAYADDAYEHGNYGYGANKDGMLFLINMGERDWYISTTGYGETAFTSYGIQYIGNDIKGKLKDKDYYKAFNRLLDDIDKFIKEAQKGKPYSSSHRVKSSSSVLWGILISAVIAAVSVLVMKAGMKTARAKGSAGDYVKRNSLNITGRQDIFLHSTITKTKRASENSSSGSGSHTSSSGASHGGGGGKF